jgi:hypothetical protein
LPVDFFSYAQTVEPVPEFGLCDNCDETPAFMSTKEEDKWIAHVECNNRNDYSFIAVDNNIPVPRKNGDMKNRCDAMLYTKKTVCFVELKDRDKNWLAHAIEQLEATITIFSKNHDITSFQCRRAYVCNRRRQNFAVSFKDTQTKFHQDNHVVLRVGTKIEELK